MNRSRLVFAHSLVLASAMACGSRTGLDVYEPLDAGRVTATDAIADRTRDTGLKGDDTGVPMQIRDTGLREAGLNPFECPFPVLAGSPLPMYANCSTRDGRSRVVGPSSPQIRWNVMLPGSASVAAGVSLVADTSGNVYATSSIADQAWMARIEGATGTVDWSTPFTSSAVGAPLLLSSGALTDYGTTAVDAALVVDLTLEGFAPSGGSSSSTNLGPIANGIGVPAVGADGSLYAAYGSEQAGQMIFGVITRVLPNGRAVWVSANLTPAMDPSSSGISAIAIGAGGLVLAGVGIANSGTGVIVALDPASGEAVWSTPLDDTPNGNPSVAPDGSIAIMSTAGTLYVLEPTGEVRTKITIGPDGGITSIALDGTILVSGPGDLLAVSTMGTVLWQVPVDHLVMATIDAAGTVIATFRDHIEGLDLATGTPHWSVAAPASVPCIGGSTLTSTGGLVAIGCVDFMGLDGEVFAFGASD